MTNAPEQRPEPDANRASLDPRCLGLVRWADRHLPTVRWTELALSDWQFLFDEFDEPKPRAAVIS